LYENTKINEKEGGADDGDRADPEDPAQALDDVEQCAASEGGGTNTIKLLSPAT